jgi:hypothetical protein
MLLPKQELFVDDEDRLLQTLKIAMSSSVLLVSNLGAKNLALGKLVDAVIPLLSPAQCSQATAIFREAIEDVMALMDDQLLPPDYHSTILNQTNACIGMLENQSRNR